MTNTENTNEITAEAANVEHSAEAVSDTTSHETNTEIIHEHTIYAEPIAHLGSFSITNSLLNTWIAVFLIVAVSFYLKKKISLVPRGFQNALEMIVEYFMDVFDNMTGDRKKTILFFPFVFSFFLFILINNWLGILPGIGTIGQVVSEHGEKVFIPYFRGGTADLNTTLALALIGVVASHILGIIATGFWFYMNRFINLKALIEMPGKVMKEPTILLINPIKVGVSLLEIVSELAKIVSLSFRLFGNIFAGEVLIATLATILAFGLPLPFMFLEVMVGLIQALVFTILVMSYIATMSSHEEH